MNDEWLALASSENKKQPVRTDVIPACSHYNMCCRDPRTGFKTEPI